jgi:hypothetical protein
LREIVANAKLCSQGQVYRLTCSRHEGPRSKTTIKRCFVQRPTLSNCASRRLQFSSCGLQENYRKIEKTETFEPKNFLYINNLRDWRRECPPQDRPWSPAGGYNVTNFLQDFSFLCRQRSLSFADIRPIWMGRRMGTHACRDRSNALRLSRFRR